MKTTTTTLALCVCLVVCATCAFAENIISNGSFEVGYLHWADNWNGTVGTSMIRTNSAAEEGIWSMACKGGIDDWANVLQAYPGDLSGLTVRVTCWVMSPSSDSAVAHWPATYNNCSVILKMEKPGSYDAINEVTGMKDVSAGGVRDQWICLTNQVDSFPANMANFKVVLLGINSAGLIYYDNVILEVLPKVLVQNGSFENGYQAYANVWNGTIPGAMMRTNSAAYDGEWSEACLGGVLPNANVFQRCPADLAGQSVLATCGSCSAVFKFEQPDSYDPIGDPAYGIPDVNAGGVRDQWFCLTNEIPSFPPDMTNFKVICMATLSNGVIYFDKVQLDIIPEPVLLGAGALSLLLLFWKKLTQ
ncbi:MAG: hypothetical protein NTV22_18995 [bacterium]|nr:hypothetical protein [bacterium]